MTQSPLILPCPSRPAPPLAEPLTARSGHTRVRPLRGAEWIFLLLCMALVSGRATAQAMPTASADPISTGFRLPTLFGSLSYAVSGSETFTSGFYSGTGFQSASGINGNLALISPSQRYPTSLVFAGGQSWSTSAQPSTRYADFAISQVLNGKNWNAVLSDSLAYLPSAPSLGPSGIPGVGDVGLPPIQTGVDGAQGILTAYATRISNSTSLSASRNITARTSLQVGGVYSILRYLDAPPGQQYNSNTYTGSAGLSHQIDARNTVSANYAYSRFTYVKGPAGFSSQTISAAYSRHVSKLLTVTVQAGPQWTTGAFTTTTPSGRLTGPTNTPNSTSLNLFANFDALYAARFASYDAGYTRGTNSGFGVTAGARSDSLHFSGSKTLARVWAVGVTTAYSRTTTLGFAGSIPISPKTFVVSGQVSRAVVRRVSAYASYSLEKQSDTGSGSLFNVFNGSFQVLAFGVTYSPPAIRFGNR